MKQSLFSKADVKSDFFTHAGEIINILLGKKALAKRERLYVASDSELMLMNSTTFHQYPFKLLFQPIRSTFCHRVAVLVCNTLETMPWDFKLHSFSQIPSNESVTPNWKKKCV